MTLPLSESYREIPLSRGLFALVSIEDYRWISEHKWHAEWHPRTKTYYAIRNSDHRKMHMLVLPVDDGMMVDHENGDTLDNRRSNLRPATSSQNAANRRLDQRSQSGYKGVHWYEKRQKWGALITKNGKRMFLGLHESKEDAARAYDAAALIHFGEFARTNFPH